MLKIAVVHCCMWSKTVCKIPGRGRRHLIEVRQANPKISGRWGGIRNAKILWNEFLIGSGELGPSVWQRPWTRSVRNIGVTREAKGSEVPPLLNKVLDTRQLWNPQISLAIQHQRYHTAAISGLGLWANVYIFETLVLCKQNVQHGKRSIVAIIIVDAPTNNMIVFVSWIIFFAILDAT